MVNKGKLNLNIACEAENKISKPIPDHERVYKEVRANIKLILPKRRKQRVPNKP